MNASTPNRISVDPKIHFGRPCVCGTRIKVHDVLELVRDGVDFAVIVKDYYPDLTAEDVRACVQYALDVMEMEDINLAATNQ